MIYNMLTQNHKKFNHNNLLTLALAEKYIHAKSYTQSTLYIN